MIRGSLFTRFFLDDGIRGTPAYRAITATECDHFAQQVRTRWTALERFTHPAEAETESEFIYPLLAELGWLHLPQQTPGKGRRDIADALLFLSTEAKDRAVAEHLPADRFRHGAVVVENEARDTLLDRASGHAETPSTQILRYLGRAEAQSGGALKWGLLTNARFWRLYWADARSRTEGFVELDLPALVGPLAPPVPANAPPDHWVRVFLLLFRRDALRPDAVTGHTFLDDAVAEGRRYQQRITAELSETIFDTAFPALIRAIARQRPASTGDDAAWLATAREAALRLLFRLLFLLYAEDRELLPLREPGYAGYSLHGLRVDAARAVDDKRTLSPHASTYWPRLAALFIAIARGDPSIGIPPYNGGLFENGPDDSLERISLPDAVLIPLVDAVSRTRDAGGPQWINYRDLSVQQLGSIYERLLEREPVRDDRGEVALRPSPYARKTSGSYYTPEELVRLILRRAVGPLLEERRAAFRAAARQLGSDRRPRPERLKELARLDPAESFLRLRVCDPAMGSGHFLVSLVDYLVEQVLLAINEAADEVAWAGAEAPYRSPLMRRLGELRTRIHAEAARNGWPVREDQLDDPHLVRRIVLKRVTYGVDLNPMAVELAKLSLWLHSFTVGAPLSFLDHHLRVGDSLFGEFVHPVESDLHGRFGLAMSQNVVQARQSAAGMATIEGLTDADLAEVHASSAAFTGVEAQTAGLRAFLDLYHAARWLPAEDAAKRTAREALFGGGLGDPVGIAGGGAMRGPREQADPRDRKGQQREVLVATAGAFARRARELASKHKFLHWEAAFPGVWDEWERPEPRGGFDAVIGNPPWDRIKMQEVEWFAARVPDVALAQRAADRKRKVANLRKSGDPIARDYDAASWTAETMADVAAGGSPFATAREQREKPARDYPLLSGGDMNLYALFVERAGRLVRKDGIVGLLVPSGIAADKGAAPFFRGISTTGRLEALIDFENRRPRQKLEPFFPDVDSRFKFCALIFGGRDRRFAQASCAFFQQDATEAEANVFPLAPADFAAVNPNTGTAPVFRSPRDADITRAIYRRLPVLVDRGVATPRAVWPVRYVRMLDMTNDSGKFRTAAELEKLGAYRVAGGSWEKGKSRWLPLYEGKMVQAFDHRAASVEVNTVNLNRPAQPLAATLEQRADPAWTPVPQFWVNAADVPDTLGYALAFKDVTSPTNVRTAIAALVPTTACGNTLPLLLPDPALPARCPYSEAACLIVANLNAFAIDYVARQKVQGQHLNSYIVEQLPMIPPDNFGRRFGPKSARDIIRDDVLHLTYVSHDMAPFARDQGHAGPPFAWDEADRLRRRARLDAVFFHLYGLNREEADYILGTFPIVRREEEARHGTFRSRDLILAWMAALEAGSPDAPIA